MLYNADYSNQDVYLHKLVQELIDFKAGVEIMINGVPTRVRVCLLTAEGDLRALPDLLGKFRDPAKLFACLDCKIPATRLGAHRAAYLQELHPCPPYDEKSPTSTEYKRTAVLGCATPDSLHELGAYCNGHGIKNSMGHIFRIHCDVGISKFSKLRDLEAKRWGHISGNNPPWKADESKIIGFEFRLIHAKFAKPPKSPFMSKSGAKGKKLREKEIYPGMASLRYDRRMVDWVRLLRSGLAELAITETVAPEYALITCNLLRAMKACLKDSFLVSEIPTLKVDVMMKVVHDGDGDLLLNGTAQ